MRLLIFSVITALLCSVSYATNPIITDSNNRQFELLPGYAFRILNENGSRVLATIKGELEPVKESKSVRIDKLPSYNHVTDAHHNAYILVGFDDKRVLDKIELYDIVEYREPGHSVKRYKIVALTVWPNDTITAGLSWWPRKEVPVPVSPHVAFNEETGSLSKYLERLNKRTQKEKDCPVIINNLDGYSLFKSRYFKGRWIDKLKTRIYNSTAITIHYNSENNIDLNNTKKLYYEHNGTLYKFVIESISLEKFPNKRTVVVGRVLYFMGPYFDKKEKDELQ